MSFKLLATTIAFSFATWSTACRGAKESTQSRTGQKCATSFQAESIAFSFAAWSAVCRGGAKESTHKLTGQKNAISFAWSVACRGGAKERIELRRQSAQLKSHIMREEIERTSQMRHSSADILWVLEPGACNNPDHHWSNNSTFNFFVKKIYSTRYLRPLFLDCGEWLFLSA